MEAIDSSSDSELEELEECSCRNLRCTHGKCEIICPNPCICEVKCPKCEYFLCGYISRRNHPITKKVRKIGNPNHVFKSVKRLICNEFYELGFWKENGDFYKIRYPEDEDYRTKTKIEGCILGKIVNFKKTEKEITSGCPVDVILTVQFDFDIMKIKQKATCGYTVRPVFFEQKTGKDINTAVFFDWSD